MCPLKYFRILFTQMCLLKTRKNWFAAHKFHLQQHRSRFWFEKKLKIQGFSTKIRKITDKFICFIVFNVHIHTVYTWFTHSCRESSLVAITRFLGGTFGQNLLGGGTKNFIWPGSRSVEPCMLNCNINGMVHILYLKSHISAQGNTSGVLANAYFLRRQLLTSIVVGDDADW